MGDILKEAIADAKAVRETALENAKMALEEAIRRLKRKVKNSNLMQDLRDREHFVKPSIIKREKRNLAKLRNQYKVQKEKENY